MGTQRLDKNREKFFDHRRLRREIQKTREILAAYERHWRLPSPPIVEAKH